MPLPQLRKTIPDSGHDSCPAPSVVVLGKCGPAAEEPEAAERAPFQLDEVPGKDQTRVRLFCWTRSASWRLSTRWPGRLRGRQPIPAGGHNPRSRQTAVPVVMGDALRELPRHHRHPAHAEARSWPPSETLVPILENLLTDDEAAKIWACVRSRFSITNPGATGRAVTALLGLLPQRQAS